jgi:hypothetical protein
MRRAALTATGGWILLAMAVTAIGGAVTLTAARDNTLYQDSDGLTSNGAGPHFFVGRILAGDIRRG